MPGPDPVEGDDEDEGDRPPPRVSPLTGGAIRAALAAPRSTRAPGPGPQPSAGGTAKASDFFFETDTTDGRNNKDPDRIVARDIRVCGWIAEPPSPNGDHEDFHYLIDVDPTAVDSKLATATLPGHGNAYDGHNAESALPPADRLAVMNDGLIDMNSFSLGTGGISLKMELNAWYPPVRGPAPAGWVEDAAHHVHTVFYPFWPDDPFGRGTTLQPGEYVCARGTIWQDIAHFGSGAEYTHCTMSANCPEKYWKDSSACYLWGVLQNDAAIGRPKDVALKHYAGWLEMHPPDAFSSVEPPSPIPEFRSTWERAVACSLGSRPTDVASVSIKPRYLLDENGVPTWNATWPEVGYRLAHWEERIDRRFSDMRTVTSHQVVPSANELAVNVTVLAPTAPMPAGYNPNQRWVGSFTAAYRTDWDIAVSPDAAEPNDEPAVATPLAAATGTLTIDDADDTDRFGFEVQGCVDLDVRIEFFNYRVRGKARGSLDAVLLSDATGRAVPMPLTLDETTMTGVLSGVVAHLVAGKYTFVVRSTESLNDHLAPVSDGFVTAYRPHVTLTAASGASETCDGADNDCDGAVDESFPDTDGDGVADCVDADIDGDCFTNTHDNCPLTPNGSRYCAAHDTDDCRRCRIAFPDLGGRLGRILFECLGKRAPGCFRNPGCVAGELDDRVLAPWIAIASKVAANDGPGALEPEVFALGAHANERTVLRALEPIGGGFEACAGLEAMGRSITASGQLYERCVAELKALGCQKDVCHP